MGTVQPRTDNGALVVVPEGDPLEDAEAYETRRRALETRDALRRMPYDPRVAAILIAHVACGRTLKSVCEECGISFGTIHKWKRSGPHAKEFREALKEAEELGAQYKVEEAVELADAPMTFPVDAMKAKLQTDLRWRLAEKHAPDRYGKRAEEGGGLDWGKVLDAVKGQAQVRTQIGAEGQAVTPQLDGATVGTTEGSDPI